VITYLRSLSPEGICASPPRLRLTERRLRVRNTACRNDEVVAHHHTLIERAVPAKSESLRRILPFFCWNHAASTVDTLMPGNCGFEWSDRLNENHGIKPLVEIFVTIT